MRERERERERETQTEEVLGCVCVCILIELSTAEPACAETMHLAGAPTYHLHLCILILEIVFQKQARPLWMCVYIDTVHSVLTSSFCNLLSPSFSLLFFFSP